MDIIINLIKMFGGLALLIYGMKLLSSNLKKMSSGKLEKILVNATNNPFKGLFVGFLITVMTQSSAATTVLVVGLVNSEILTLSSAIPIIMGANIGTTLNSQILRLANLEGSSWISFFTPATFAPILLIIALLILEKAKKQKTKDIGNMIMGLGLLFTGMLTMVGVASGFSDLPILSTILKQLSNPILGIIAGVFITALVQSSSATIGILQALSTTGQITYATTIPIILGQNIGTCFTSMLASIGGSTNAKRVAAVHLYFNLIGTILFVIFIYTYQYTVGFGFWNHVVDMGGIANFHLIFNVVSTIILFPSIKLIEKLTIVTIKDKKTVDSEEDDALLVLNELDSRVATIPRVALTNVENVVQKMGEFSLKNFRRTTSLLDQYDSKIMEKISKREDTIDKMEEVVTKYLVSFENQDLSEKQNRKVTALLRIESEYEKVGDYAYRLSKTMENIRENNVTFSKSAINELHTMFQITEDAILKTMEIVTNRDANLSLEIAALREFADIRKEEYKGMHIRRLKKGNCSVDSGITFIEILTCCDSIFNHCFNICIAMNQYDINKNIVTRHDYRKELYQQNQKYIYSKLKEFKKAYR
ncbi:MAG: Na/Pi cotransporter family protein [Bacilli bacterium]|nr:Na/Pi cotransporter family protein [Bacilli bacterium]